MEGEKSFGEIVKEFEENPKLKIQEGKAYFDEKLLL